MENYEEICELGYGSYGTVTKCRDVRTGRIVAIKKHVYMKATSAKLAIRREYALLCRMPHDNVVELLDVFLHKGYVHGVFAYVRCTVHDEMNNTGDALDAATVRRYSYQLLRAVAMLHQHGVIHRDIKPDNLLVSRAGVLKLADFGNARHLPRKALRCAPRWRCARLRRLTPMPCALCFSSPEILLEDVYGKPADVWAIGCSILVMATWHYFLQGRTDRGELKEIVRKVGSLSPWQQRLYRRKFGRYAVLPRSTRQHASLEQKYGLWDHGLAHLVDLCLQVDPARRPSCSRLLEHNYFTEDGFADMFPSELQEKLQMDAEMSGSYDYDPSFTESWDEDEEADSSLTTWDEGTDSSLSSSEEDSQEHGSTSQNTPDGEPRDSRIYPSTSKNCSENVKSTKEVKAKRGIKDSFVRAFKAIQGMFTRCDSREDKPGETVVGDTSREEGPVAELRTEHSVAEVPPPVQEGGAGETSTKKKRGLWNRFRYFFKKNNNNKKKKIQFNLHKDTPVKSTV